LRISTKPDAIEIAHQMLSRDLSHQLIGVVKKTSAIPPETIGEAIGELLRGRGLEMFQIVLHAESVPIG